MHFHGISFKDAGIYTELLLVPLNKWDGLWRRTLYGVYMDMLLALDCSVHRVSVRQSNIWNADVENGVFALRPMQFNDRVGYYHGSLIYTDLGVLPQGLEWYREYVMHVTADFLSACTSDLPDRITD